MTIGTAVKTSLAMLKETPKEKPLYELNEKVIVHLYGNQFRIGFVKEIITAKRCVYDHEVYAVKQKWLLAHFLPERVKDAESLYGSPWVYLIQYTDKKPWAKEQYNGVQHIRKYEGLNATLYGE